MDMFNLWHEAVLAGIRSLLGVSFCGNARLFMRITGGLTMGRLILTLVQFSSRLVRALLPINIDRHQSRV